MLTPDAIAEMLAERSESAAARAAASTTIASVFACSAAVARVTSLEIAVAFAAIFVS